MSGAPTSGMVKVLVSEPVVKIEGEDFRHHQKGGGLVSVNASVPLSARVELYSTVHNGAKIGSDAEILGVSAIEEGVTVAPGARLLNCVVGKGSIIGIGVELSETTIPDYSDVKVDKGLPGGISISRRKSGGGAG